MAGKVLLWKQLHEKVGLSRSTVWRLEREGKFVRRRKISPFRVGWLEHEVDEWLRTRPEVA